MALLRTPWVEQHGGMTQAEHNLDHRFLARALIVVLGFGAVSAAAGLAIAIPGGGAGFPLGALDGTPFTSFVIPGLILGLVVGGTQLAGLTALWRRDRLGLFFASVAGFGMLIWIFTEVVLIGYSALQTVYFTVGGLELVLVLLLLGVIPGDAHRRHAG